MTAGSRTTSSGRIPQSPRRDAATRCGRRAHHSLHAVLDQQMVRPPLSRLSPLEDLSPCDQFRLAANPPSPHRATHFRTVASARATSSSLMVGQVSAEARCARLCKRSSRRSTSGHARAPPPSASMSSPPRATMTYPPLKAGNGRTIWKVRANAAPAIGGGRP